VALEHNMAASILVVELTLLQVDHLFAFVVIQTSPSDLVDADPIASLWLACASHWDSEVAVQFVV